MLLLAIQGCSCLSSLNAIRVCLSDKCLVSVHFRRKRLLNYLLECLYINDIRSKSYIAAVCSARFFYEYVDYLEFFAVYQLLLLYLLVSSH